MDHGPLGMALASPCGDQRPGGEVEATVRGTGVMERAPEVALRPQMCGGPHVQGGVSRPGGAAIGAREDRRAGW
jgi:hypothetical protein